MAAEVLSLDDFPRPGRVFKIPLRSEVSKYIHEKTGWPEKFCDHYADKFWYFYQAKGWVVGKSPMKDWKAAFNSQWKTIKDQEDNKLLTKLQSEESKESDPIKYLNKCLELHKQGKYKPSKEEVLGIYDYLKSTGKINKGTFTQAEWDKMVADAGNSKERGRMLAVKRLFDKLNAQNTYF